MTARPKDPDFYVEDRDGYIVCCGKSKRKNGLVACTGFPYRTSVKP